MRSSHRNLCLIWLLVPRCLLGARPESREVLGLHTLQGDPAEASGQEENQPKAEERSTLFHALSAENGTKEAKGDPKKVEKEEDKGDPKKAEKEEEKGDPKPADSDSPESSEGPDEQTEAEEKKAKEAKEAKEEKEAKEAKEERDAGKAEPIPGSAKWGRLHTKKNAHKCGKELCCDRGSTFDVEEDRCEKSKGHDVATKSPADEVKDYQTSKRNFRIPSAIDNNGIRGCTLKNSVGCKDEEDKKMCCCNVGFGFNFESRQCVEDDSDTAKEDPVPGSQTWGLMKKKGEASKCIHEPTKWCCHRGCEYDIGKDRCGNCRTYVETSPTAWKSIQEYVDSKGNYVIPPAIDKPSMLFGKCSTKEAKKCSAEQAAGDKHCCCHQGLAYSFESRRCVTIDVWRQEQPQDPSAPQSAAYASPPQAQQPGPAPAEDVVDIPHSKAAANAMAAVLLVAAAILSD